MFWKRPYRTLNLIQIDKEALIHNVRLYQSMLPGTSICPVLKSNAYGHGLTKVAKALDGMELDFFVIDSLYEAFQLKKLKIKTPLLILGYTKPKNLKKKHKFHFAAFDEESLKRHAKLKHPIHLEVDTGMNRMGFNLENLKSALDLAKKHKANIVGLFSHFATADNTNNSGLESQEAIFQQAIEVVHKEGFHPKWIHLGNSAGSIKSSLKELNMARLGISLYGINPMDEEDPYSEKLSELKPAMEVKSCLIAVRELNPGEKISYGYTYEAKKKITIGVLPFGYYEGLPISLSNEGRIEVNGASCPIVGRVCMNHTMIDITATDAKLGDEVKVYTKYSDHNCSFAKQSKKAGTIPYELMVRLSESVRRV
jgi:alanine racemase